jgi:hypothetical protein
MNKIMKKVATALIWICSPSHTNSAFGGEHSSIGDEKRDFILMGGPNARPGRVSSNPYPMECYLYATWMIWIGSSSCSSSSQHKNPTKQTESGAPNNQKAAEIDQDSEAAAMESRSLETCSRSSISLFHKTMAGMQLPAVGLRRAAVYVLLLTLIHSCLSRIRC